MPIHEFGQTTVQVPCDPSIGRGHFMGMSTTSGPDASTTGSTCVDSSPTHQSVTSTMGFLSDSASATPSRVDGRRSNKPVMEKRRRARINTCLTDLKSLILDAMKKDPSRHSKLEKADILEMTVKHLQNVQRAQLALAVARDPRVLGKFKTGFAECATEASRYMTRIEGCDTGLRTRMSTHLTACVAGLQSLTPLAFTAMAAPSLAAANVNIPTGVLLQQAAANSGHASATAANDRVAVNPAIEIPVLKSSGELPAETFGLISTAVNLSEPAPEASAVAAKLLGNLQNVIASRLPTGEIALVLPHPSSISSKPSATERVDGTPDDDTIDTYDDDEIDKTERMRILDRDVAARKRLEYESASTCRNTTPASLIVTATAGPCDLRTSKASAFTTVIPRRDVIDTHHNNGNNNNDEDEKISGSGQVSGPEDLSLKPKRPDTSQVSSVDASASSSLGPNKRKFVSEPVLTAMKDVDHAKATMWKKGRRSDGDVPDSMWRPW